ncbi:MAG TPA: hypothetical protein VJW51_14940 [Candidatus Acidoferrales bacterium]|nr:hypothetical protein [Candidatus Acidoferrales bacterium]
MLNSKLRSGTGFSRLAAVPCAPTALAQLSPAKAEITKAKPANGTSVHVCVRRHPDMRNAITE